jgi:hypothetical protein
VDRHRQHGTFLTVCKRLLCAEECSRETTTETVDEKPDRDEDKKPDHGIIAQRVARGPHYEAKESHSLIGKTRVVRPIGYSVDRAYDSEEIRRVVREEVRAARMIPLRKRAKSGTYRRAMLEKFDEELYHRRNLVETMFSVEKRVFGDVNRSRSGKLRNKENKLRNVYYKLASI